MSYNPLFPAGFHNIIESNLLEIFVEPFDIQERRQYLIKRFKALLDRFREAGINAEVWIDGSFATEKPEPGDIDAIFFINSEDVNQLTHDKQKILTELNTRMLSKIRYQCDVFIVPNNDPNIRSYWRGWFGFSEEEIPKGIINALV